MTVSTPGSNLGRHVFGVAALAFGLITLAWQDYNGWHLPRYLVYAAAAALIFGGAAIQFHRTARAGAAVRARAAAVRRSVGMRVLQCGFSGGIASSPRILRGWIRSAPKGDVP